MSLKFNWGGYYEALNFQKTLSIKELVELDNVFQVLVDFENFASLEDIMENRKTWNTPLKINKLNSPLLDSIIYFIFNMRFLRDEIELIKFLSTKNEYNLDINCVNRELTQQKLFVYKNYDKLAYFSVEKNFHIILAYLLEKYEIILYDPHSTRNNILLFAVENNAKDCIKLLLPKINNSAIITHTVSKIKSIEIFIDFIKEYLERFGSKLIDAVSSQTLAEYCIDNFSGHISLLAYNKWYVLFNNSPKMHEKLNKLNSSGFFDSNLF